MFLNASSKKIRSISDGNFRGCYVSNKAEKFKFRRLSQSLESCAHAQALKLRKEEKQVHKLLENLEKDKIRYVKTKNNDDHYPPADRGCNSHLKSSELLSRISPVFGQKSAENKVKSHDNKNFSRNTEGPSKNAQQRLSSKSRDFHEVTPFYLEHGYSQYHRSSKHYEKLLKNTDALQQSDCHRDLNTPCWTKVSNLSRLRSRRAAICYSTNPLGDLNATTNMIPLEMNTHMSNLSTINNIKPDQSYLDNNSSTFVNVGNSLPSLPSINGHEENSCFPLKAEGSVLTPLERQELVQHARTRAYSVSAMVSTSVTTAFKKLKAERNRRHTVHNAGKDTLLRTMVHNRLKQGASFEDLFNDRSFDEVLDMLDEHRVHPAYEPEMKLTFHDFRALRNCKYLRLSKLNLRSLKEATLRDIGSKA